MIDYLVGHESVPRILPSNKSQGNKTKSIVDIIAWDIHPVCNLRVLKYLTRNLNIDE